MREMALSTSNVEILAVSEASIPANISVQEKLYEDSVDPRGPTCSANFSVGLWFYRSGLGSRQRSLVLHQLQADLICLYI